MAHDKQSPHDARVSAGVTQIQLAAAAGVALATLQRFELDPRAVRPIKRAALEAAYRRLLDLDPRGL